jgi:hypothetical protein
MRITPQEETRLMVEALVERLPKVAEELSSAALPDKSLKKRFYQVVEMLCSDPEKSFPEMADEDKAKLKGLYRFLENKRVEEQVLFEPHAQATCARAAELERVLAVHDTTCICYGGRGTRRGLGRLNDGGHGYCLHCTLCVTADGSRIPLGVLGYEVLVRTEEPKKPRSWREEQKNPDKEKARWWRRVKHTSDVLKGARVKLIHVMDREADDYELLAQMLNAGEHFVVRQRFDRLLELSQEARREGAPRKVHEALAEAKVQFEREVPLSPRKKDRSGEKQKTYPPREGRVARLVGSAMRLSIRRPQDLKDSGLPESIQLNVVRVWEPEPPEGQPGVEWYLMTTEPIERPEQILEVVDFYRARWTIEEFFKALKTGCSIEKRQLETKEALLKALAMFLPIAWRLLLMRSLARSAPELPATVVLSDTQLRILRARPKLKLPEQPTVKDALWAIASIGGHLKHNGAPGWQTIGRGFEKLLALEEGWNLAHSMAR